MRITSLVLAASLALAPGFLGAQVPATRFEHLSVEDGLPHSAVRDIEQDRYGFLWFATHNGLSRYDGYRFRVFRHDPEDPNSRSSSSTSAVLEDREGQLWIGTENGLDLYHRGEGYFQHFRHDPDDDRSLSHDAVQGLYQDHTGALWIGTTSGLNRRREDGTFQRYGHDPSDATSLSDPRIQVVTEDADQRLWVGTYGGLDLFDRASESFRHFHHDPADPESLSHDLINAIQVDGDGFLWIGTASGLNRFDPTTETFTRYREGPVDLGTERIFEVLPGQNGEIWVGTLNAGLIRIPTGGGPPVQYRHDAADPWSLTGDRIISLFADRDGILWAGTWTGLNKYDRRLERFAIYRREPGREPSLTDSNISALLEDRDGILWVGTWDKGLNRVDRARGHVVHYQEDPVDPTSLPDSTVQALCEDRDGALWVATWGGLARLDHGAEGFVVYRPEADDPTSLDSDAVLSVYEDSRDRIWVGTIHGLSRFEPEIDGFTRFRDGVAEHDVSSIVEDRSGGLWYGSNGKGLFYLEPAGGKADAGGASLILVNHRHDPADSSSLASNDVNYLYESRSGDLWIATGAGLDRLDPARRLFTHFRERDGLTDNQVLGILEDDAGHLWLSTSSGLSRLDPSTGTFRNYGAEDGLQSSVFSYRSAHRSSRGEMFFGGIHGFNAFLPDEIQKDPFDPPVVLTDFQLFNESVPVSRVDPGSPLERSLLETDALRLTHRQSVFSIEFAALHYAAPEKVLYAYRLEGFDDDWIQTGTGKRFATYTNLDGGSYRFRVRAGLADGTWSESEASLGIEIAPAPWKSWWAYTLYALALVTAVALAFGAQRRKLERERAVSRRLREVDQLKDEFLANTSHELRTPLYGITGMAESLIDGAAGQLPEAARAHLALLVQSGRRLSSLVNDILDYSKLEHQSLELALAPVDLRALNDVVLTLAAPLAADKGLELSNTVDADLPPAEADTDRIQQVLHNLVGNAIKYTDSGRVEVSTQLDGDWLEVSVRDTGIGIAKDQLKQIFKPFVQTDASIQRRVGGTGLGLAVSQQLVELHGGTMKVESTPGRGSIFSFTVPVSTQHVAAPADTNMTVEEVREPVGTVPISPLAMAPVDVIPAVVGVGEAASHGDTTILVVDDEPIVRQVLENHLAPAGYRVLTTPSGPAALELLGRKSVDLVLLDIMMPRMSGYEVCRILRQGHPIESLPILFLSAMNRTDDRTAALEQGGSDYIAKPVAKTELLSRVHTHLEVLEAHRRKEQEVVSLRGLLPICIRCKKVRDDEGYWNEIETYISRHSEAEFSHGICQPCADELYPELFDSE